MDWRRELLDEIARTEREAGEQVEAVVRAGAARVRERADGERHRLRAALLAQAQAVSDAADRAALAALEAGSRVAQGRLLAGDRERATAGWAAATVAADRIRERGRVLADEVRAAEGELADGLVRATRPVLQDGLPAVRRILADAAHRTADELRGDLELRERPPPEGIGPWKRRVADAV